MTSSPETPPEIITLDQAKARNLKMYYTGEPCIHGHVAMRRTINQRCVQCGYEAHREWVKSNPERVRVYREAERVFGKRYEPKDREVRLLRMRQYHANNREIIAEKLRLKKASDPERYREASRQRTKKAKARGYKPPKPIRTLKDPVGTIPLSRGHINEMREIYRGRPRGYEVDHIFPLRGTNSCGIHAPWNLQYLTIKENRDKRNKIINDPGWYTAFLPRPD